MIIQKFGGIAMQNEQQRAKCIQHIRRALSKYRAVIVVVSAMGRGGDPYSTDQLLTLTNSFSKSGEARDLAAACGELIASAVLSAELTTEGIDNTIIYGQNTGIRTKGAFCNATIEKINSTHIVNTLQTHSCIIVPGFQGMNTQGQFMTLGRGGSDLTAIALASSLQASHVEFFKDVPGVMSADPHKTSNYTRFDRLTFDEFLPLLQCERPVIQEKAAVYAKKTAMPLHIRGIASNEEGTWILP
ncbi:aspartate kinase [Sporosarcina sp. P37]|uniref:amino acid kinase family protein n=1 Tax=unclassified Sporosarcina TaxID=2647733 RepID=UPI000A17E6D8|nr:MULTISPECIES: aspartate kinase [unclassified Sporosarcina]ARK25665.1 aspartate kinase [Sporosarcina sp. P37]PID19313.1 aspartate kinase [Sporosarcina sp. P35]